MHHLPCQALDLDDFFSRYGKTRTIFGILLLLLSLSFMVAAHVFMGLIVIPSLIFMFKGCLCTDRLPNYMTCLSIWMTIVITGSGVSYVSGLWVWGVP